MTNSAIVLGVTLALVKYFKYDLSEEECATIAYSALSTFSAEECRLIIFLAMLHVDSTSLLLFDVQYLKYEKIPIDNLDDEIVPLLVESQIAPQALQEELSIRRGESREAFKLLRALFPTGLIRDIPQQEIREMVGQLTEDEKRLCIYVLGESRLAYEGGRLLAQKDMVGYGRVLSKVQAGLRDIFEVTCPEIDWLTKRAMELNGCLGATMISTGRSGTILVLISRESIALYITRMEEYEHIFGFKPTWKSYTQVGKLKIGSVNNGSTTNKR